jgi:hypothetical protein
MSNVHEVYDWIRNLSMWYERTPKLSVESAVRVMV